MTATFHLPLVPFIYLFSFMYLSRISGFHLFHYTTYMYRSSALDAPQLLRVVRRLAILTS